MQAAIYLRVSTEEQAREGVSLDVQEHECRARALAMGATSVAVYRDEGLSGSRWDRPGLQALLASLPALDLVIAWDLSRLSRTLEHQLAIMRMLAENATLLVCLRQDVQTDTAAGRLQVNVLGAFGQFQREQTAETIREVLAHLRADGVQTGAAPFGYLGSGAEVIPDPKTAPVVRELYRRAARGETLGEMLRYLNAGAAAPPRGQTWCYSTLRRILTSAYYLGSLSQAGPRLDGKHTGIVPLATWRKVQERMSRDAVVHPRARSGSWSSLYRCGHCGAAVHRHGDGGGRRVDVYRCSLARTLPVEARHASIATTAPKADEFLWRTVAGCISDGTLEEAVAEGRRRETGRQRAGHEERLAAIIEDGEGMLAENLRLYHRGLLTEAVLGAENAALTQEVQQARAELEAIRAAQVTDRQAADWKRMVVDSARGVLDAMSRDQRKEFLRRVTGGVLLRHNHLDIQLAIPGLPTLGVDLPERWGPLRYKGQ